MPSIVRGPLAVVIGCVGIVTLDQWSKRLFFPTDAISVQPVFSFLKGWIQSVRHENFGIAFNLPIPQWLILAITFVACIGILVALCKEQRRQRIAPSLFLGILLGGALGNAFDRLWLGYVRDWLLLWHRSAINIADLGVITGLVGLLWTQSRHIHPLDKT